MTERQVIQFDRDAGLSVCQGCWIECSTRFLDWVFDRDVVGLRVEQGCWSRCWQGCLFQCLTWSLNVMLVQGCWIVCMTRMLDWLFDRDCDLSGGRRCCMEYLARILIDCSAGNDLGRAFNEYVGGLLDSVFHQHAGFRVRQGCCIECLTGKLDWVFHRYAGLSGKKGSLIEYLIRLLIDWVFDKRGELRIWYLS